MKNLINLTEDSKGNIAVSGRELHKGLEIETQYTKWINRMVDYGFEENTDFITISQKRLTAQGNETTFTDHIMTLDMAKEISMIQRSEIGKKLRKYFIEVEKKYIEQLKLETNVSIKESKPLTQNNEIIKETTLENWRKDIKDNIDKIAIDNSYSYADRKDTTKQLWIKLYELFDFNNKTCKGLRTETSEMKKQWKKENKGHRCTLNTLDFIEQDSKHIELIIKCYNTLSKQYESPYKLSMDNKVNLVIDKNDTLKLKQLSEMVALQNIVESSGNETPKDYRQELVNLVSGNKELLSYAVDSNIFSLEEIK